MSTHQLEQTQKQGGKIGLNTLISWGASVVIIGLMFKLLHWQGGEWMIGIGLGVEACLFFLLGMHAMNGKAELHEAPTQQQQVVHRTNNQLDELLNQSISPMTIEKLNKGFEKFNQTVESVNSVAGHARITQSMMNEIEHATLEIHELRKNIAQLNSKYKAQLDAFGK